MYVTQTKSEREREYLFLCGTRSKTEINVYSIKHTTVTDKMKIIFRVLLGILLLL